MNNYENDYDDMRLYPKQNKFLAVIKGTFGAVIGAIPGMLIWILISKLGYITAISGAVLSVGVLLGYSFFSGSKNMLDDEGMRKFSTIGLIICIAVMLIAAYVTTRVIWTWEIVDAFEKSKPLFRQSIISELNAAGISYTQAELDAVLTDEYIADCIFNEFGIRETNFFECNKHFSSLIDAFSLKAEYIKEVIFGYLFIGAGAAVAVWSKLVNK